MKRAATILLLLSIGSITLFGFNAMHAASGTHGTRCLASAFTVAEPPCPESNVVGFIGYHLDAFRTFSLATLISFTSLLFVTSALWTIHINQPLNQPLLVSARAFSRRIPILPSQFRSASEWRWYSLHENSPSYS